MNKIFCIIISCLFVTFHLQAASISGVYKTERPDEVSITIKQTGKIVRIDKKGRFSLKGIKAGEDTIIISTPQFKLQPIVLPLTHKDCKQVGSIVIKESEDDTSTTVDVCYKPKPIVIETLYGGTILKREDLESTGERMVLSAIQIKYPQRPATSFTQSTDPLYYIDGVEVTDISHVPLSEIAYVEYLNANNAACSSLGSRGGNGAIFITTDSKYKTSENYREEPQEVHLYFKSAK